MTTKLIERYREMIASGAIARDPAQAVAVEKLQILSNRLAVYTPPKKTDFFAFFTRTSGLVPRGLYMFGGVGRGKTMLMDLFFSSVPFAKKRRVHFHEFMAESHERIAEARKTNSGDPVPRVGEQIAREAALLCFDELHVTDITDAMILGRLFSVLFERGSVIVSTSNVPPGDLYKDGLNRDRFEPFIDLIEHQMEILELEAARDYRLDKLTSTPHYITPIDDHTGPLIRDAWVTLTGCERGEPDVINVKGRTIDVPEAALGVARFTFGDLCARPLGPADYLAIARQYHTIIVENVPLLTPDKRNEARRFINLIDTLYDNRIGLIVSAAAGPQALYPEGDGAFLFERTASRLIEMRSPDYLKAREDRVKLTAG